MVMSDINFVEEIIILLLPLLEIYATHTHAHSVLIEQLPQNLLISRQFEQSLSTFSCHVLGKAFSENICEHYQTIGVPRKLSMAITSSFLCLPTLFFASSPVSLPLAFPIYRRQLAVRC